MVHYCHFNWVWSPTMLNIEVCLHVTFLAVSIILFIVIRITDRIGDGPIRTVTSDTMLNNNGGNSGHGLENITCKQTLEVAEQFNSPLLTYFKLSTHSCSRIEFNKARYLCVYIHPELSFNNSRFIGCEWPSLFWVEYFATTTETRSTLWIGLINRTLMCWLNWTSQKKNVWF